MFAREYTCMLRVGIRVASSSTKTCEFERALRLNPEPQPIAQFCRQCPLHPHTIRKHASQRVHKAVLVRTGMFTGPCLQCLQGSTIYATKSAVSSKLPLARTVVCAVYEVHDVGSCSCSDRSSPSSMPKT